MGIQEWEFKLTDYTDSDNWRINFELFTWEEHRSKLQEDFPQCNVFVLYGESDENRALGRTGFDHNDSKHKYTTFVIFTHSIRQSELFAHFTLEFNEDGQGEWSAAQLEKKPKLFTVLPWTVI